MTSKCQLSFFCILNSIIEVLQYCSDFFVRENKKNIIRTLESGEYAKLAYYNDVVVGAVCCRVDVTNPEEGQIAKKKLYIMTLGCLAPYRRLGNHIFCLIC